MADIIATLEESLANAMRQSDTLARALADERRTAETLRTAVRNGMHARAALESRVAELAAELAAAHVSQRVTTAAIPDASAERRTATAHVAHLATATGTAESTVRGNLTLSPTFGQLRDNAAAVDGVPLTQSERLLDWLCDTVPDRMNHYRTRYEQLLRRQLSLESML